jgi:hypothetical protein
MTAIVPFNFHVRVGLTTSLFLLLSPPESSLYFFSYKYMPRDLLLPFFLIGLQEWYLGKEYQTWNSHVRIFYSIIFLSHSCDKMFFSAPCCPKTSRYVVPLTCKIDFYLHTKPRKNQCYW